MIGPDETPITTHGGAIAALSKPLDRLTNGPFEEAQSQVAKFPELEASDFERICEYAYQANYTNPELEKGNVNGEGDQHEPPTSSIAESYDRGARGRVRQFIERSYKGQKDYTLKTISTGRGRFMLDKIENGWLRRVDDGDEVQPIWCAEHEPWKFNFGEILKSYARIYVFALKYMIDELKLLTLHKMHNLLCALPLYPTTKKAVTELLAYAYNNEHTPDRTDTSRDGSIDPLRDVLMDFLVVHVSSFRRFKSHQDMLLQGGDYSIDMVDKLSECD